MKAGEELTDFGDGATAFGADEFLHAEKTAARLPSSVDAVRWAHTVHFGCSLTQGGKSEFLPSAHMLVLERYGRCYPQSNFGHGRQKMGRYLDSSWIGVGEGSAK
ncbi:MAG: hypothetical protein EBS01_02515 [Verrucomicrobia bacterium]|nr:hypothetical protein [Verrucomicrobiota bacterium]